jgi:hypothetical protein
MAQRVQITTLCDVDGTRPGVTVTFGARGVSYEIDLCDEHAEQFDQGIEQWIGSGRRIGGRRQTVRVPGARLPVIAATPPPPIVEWDVNKGHRAKVREWARANGYRVGQRGRISQEVYDAYEKANA